MLFSQRINPSPLPSQNGEGIAFVDMWFLPPPLVSETSLDILPGVEGKPFDLVSEERWPEGKSRRPFLQRSESLLFRVVKT